MKNINKILSLLIFSSLLCSVSCKKSLEKLPYNAIAEEMSFLTPLDFDNAVRGMYRPTTLRPNGITPVSTYFGGSSGADIIIMPDLLADNLIVNTAGRNTHLEDHYWYYNANRTSTLFEDAYIMIRRANAVLANIDNGVITGTKKDNYKGEALVMRAWMHFNLACMYCKVPSANIFNPGFINSSVDLGIPYVTSLDFKELPARGSIGDTYNKIVDDLATAEELVPTANAVENGRWHKAAVAGLLAKVYLYMGQWQNAVDAATRSLALNNNVGTPTDLANIWTDATSTGVLFKVKVLDADNVTPGVAYSQPDGTSFNSEYVCTFDLYQLYSNTDVRKNIYVKSLPHGGANRLHIVKHVGRATGNANVVDIKLLRVADVLLIRAEASARLGNMSAAVTDLNTLRQNRYNPYVAYVFTTQAALINEILLQRRLELAFEGQRFYDLKRLNRSVSRDPNFGDQADGNGEPFSEAAVQMDSTDHRMQLPFPQIEINTNSNFKQNPGY